MNIDLFFSGAPSDNEWVPKNDDINYCDKYFAYEESQQNVDYEIEVFPNRGCSYYTYMHHKGVNGYARGNSYFAMTLKITGGYCSDIVGLYHLFNTVYHNWIIGTIISLSNGVETYKVSSLSSTEMEEVRKKVEEKVVNWIELMSLEYFRSFDESFSRSRRQNNLEIGYVGQYRNETLVDELKSSHRLHLISDTDKIMQLETLLKDTKSEKSKIRRPHLDQKNERDISLSNKDQSITQGIGEIKSMLQTMQQAYLSDQHGQQQNSILREANENVHTIKAKMLSWLPWILCVLLAIGLLIVIVQPSPNTTTQSSLTDENKQLKNCNEQLEQKISDLATEIDSLKTELGKRDEILEGVKGAVSGSSSISTKPTYIDVADCNNNTVKIGKHEVVAMARGGKKFPDVEWRINSGDEYAEKQGSFLICNKEGNIELTASYEGGLLKRQIKIEQ